MKVTQVVLQSAVTIPGSSVQGSTHLMDEKQKGIKMEYKDGAIWVEHKGKKAIIPLTNVKIAVFKDEEVETVAVKRKANAAHTVA